MREEAKTKTKTRGADKITEQIAQPITQPINEQIQPPASVKNEQGEQEEQPATYEIYNNIIYTYVDEFIEREYAGRTQEELKTDKAFFPRLTQYLYNNYIGELLGNKYGKQIMYKDINLLDNIFNVYIDLVFKYKWNDKPFIVEYSNLTGISRDVIYNWANGIDNRAVNIGASEYLTPERSHIVQKWIQICEQALLNGSSADQIRDIFILKAKHNYRDNNNDLTITVNHKAIVSADVLPDLIGINSKD